MSTVKFIVSFGVHGSCLLSVESLLKDNQRREFFASSTTSHEDNRFAWHSDGDERGFKVAPAHNLCLYSLIGELRIDQHSYRFDKQGPKIIGESRSRGQKNGASDAWHGLARGPNRSEGAIDHVTTYSKFIKRETTSYLPG